MERPALAVSNLVYAFVTDHGPAWGWFSLDLFAEIRCIRALVLLTGVNLAAPWAPVAFCTDSSLQGFVVAETQISTRASIGVFSFDEKRCFIDPDDEGMWDDRPFCGGPGGWRCVAR